MDEEQEPKAKKPKTMDEAEGEENKLTKAKPSKSKLSEDVIYGIAEQMFFKKPFSNPTLSEIDLTKQNPYTIFMGHCQVHLNAMMAQFAKLKRIEFSQANNGKDMVSFYKYKEGSNSNSPNLDIKDAFSGPYRVTKPMAFGVIEYGKLRVSAVQTTNYLKKEMKKKTVSANDDQIRQQQRPIEAFSSLFLNNNMSDSEDIAQHYQLNIELLEVCERADVIEANLHSLLALDSVEIQMKIANVLDHTRADSIFFGSLSGQSNCRAIKTRKIGVNAGITLDAPIAELTQFGLKWQQQVRFLVASCPNLELLEFQLSIYFNKKFLPERIFQHLDAIVKAVKNMLEQLKEGGGQLRVSVDLLASCGFHDYRDYRNYMQILRSLDNSRNVVGNQIFKLGTPFAFDPYAFATGATAAPNATPSYCIARSLTIVDKFAATGTAGQRSHLFKFKVFERLQTAKKCATHAEAMRIPPLPHPYSPHTDVSLRQTAKKVAHQGDDLEGGRGGGEKGAAEQQNDNNYNDKHKRNKEKEEEPVDLDSSSDSAAESSSSADEDEEEEEQEDNDDEEDDGDEEEEQKKEEQQQPVAGTSKTAQNDDDEEQKEEEKEGKEEEEEEPDKKRARLF